MKNIALLFYLFFFVCLFYSCSKSGDENKKNNKLTILSISPSNVKGGDTLTVYGKNFLADGDSIKVMINKKPIDLLSLSNDSLKAKIPLKIGSDLITVVTNSSSYEGPAVHYQYEAIVSTIAGKGDEGSDDGYKTDASFKCPWGIVVDDNSDIYVADSYNRLIRKINQSTGYVSSFSIPLYLQFYSPYNITIDKQSKSLYVTDFNTNLIKAVPKNGYADYSLIYTDKMPLAGIGISKDKFLYVSNNTYGTIVKVDTNGQKIAEICSGLITPRNIFFDTSGSMYVTSNVIYKIAGSNYNPIYSTLTNFQGWESVINSRGEFFLADHSNNVIKMIDRLGNVSIIAGSGNAADIDGVGINASFDGPCGIAIDNNDNLYITTYNFNTRTGNRVRKIILR